MDKFFYSYLKPKFGANYELLMTDTDSLYGLVHTDDFYEVIRPDIQQWFDTRNLLMFPTINAFTPGKFKDEQGGKPITRFIGLRSKQYAYETEERVNLKCKGISKQGMRQITFDDYLGALHRESKTKFTQMHVIRSHHHQNYSETILKKVLDPNDDKRYILLNGIDTLP